MKPSEYFLSESPLRVKLYMGEFNKTKTIFDELDKQFINREELKDKIIILFKKRLDDKVINDENFLVFNDFKCDILELLK